MNTNPKLTPAQWAIVLACLMLVLFCVASLALAFGSL
jgi:hypothetical protein